MLENKVFDLKLFWYFPGCGGYVVGGWVGGIENKANSVQLLFQLPTGSELGKKYMEKKNYENLSDNITL